MQEVIGQHRPLLADADAGRSLAGGQGGIGGDGDAARIVSRLSGGCRDPDLARGFIDQAGPGQQESTIGHRGPA